MSSALWCVMNGLAVAPPGIDVQHRRLDFEKAALGQPAAHRRDDAAAPPQGLAALRVHDQVEIALAIAHLDIGEAVIFLGQRQQRLGQHRDAPRR